LASLVGPDAAVFCADWPSSRPAFYLFFFLSFSVNGIVRVKSPFNSDFADQAGNPPVASLISLHATPCLLYFFFSFYEEST